MYHINVAYSFLVEDIYIHSSVCGGRDVYMAVSMYYINVAFRFLVEELSINSRGWPRGERPVFNNVGFLIQDLYIVSKRWGAHTNVIFTFLMQDLYIISKRWGVLKSVIFNFLMQDLYSVSKSGVYTRTSSSTF